jgi:glycosyltransferase involved in cell wall biosynthesis
MTRRLQRLAKQFHFEVVHADTLGLAPYVSLLPHAGKVLNHHDIESALVQRRAAHGGNLMWRKFWSLEAAHLLAAERRWCPSFDVNMVVSEDEGHLIKPSCGESRICVVPNGVDVTYFTPRPDPGGNRLLFCGRLDQLANKGAITYFFKSIWPELSARLSTLEIDVVGKNPPHWLLELSQRDLSVHVPGFVEDVRPYMNDASAYIVPIRIGGGTRLKIYEAMAMEIPMVSTTVGAEGLPVRDGSELIIADAPRDFAAAIIKLLRDDKEAARRLAHNAAQLVREHYSWQNSALIFAELCTQATERTTLNSKRQLKPAI